MKRLTYQFDYRNAWREIFGSNADKVEVLEATRCLRCDSEKFAIICRIRLRGGIAEADLLGKGRLTSIETLYGEKDGSLTVFLQGKWRKTPWRRGTRIVQYAPPRFLDANTMRVELLGPESEIQEYVRHAQDSKVAHRILALTSLDPKHGDQLDGLTSKQRGALLGAYGLGYYDVPRRVSSEQVARRMRIDKSTLVEHLRKAERKVLAGILSD